MDLFPMFFIKLRERATCAELPCKDTIVLCYTSAIFFDFVKFVSQKINKLRLKETISNKSKVTKIIFLIMDLSLLGTLDHKIY